MAIDFEFAALLRSALATDVTVLAATDHLAEEVAEKVKENAPVFSPEKGRRKTPPYGAPGAYRDSITVEHHPTEPLGRRVISRDFKAIWIEVGSRHMPEYAPFTKAAAYYGAPGPILNQGVHDAQHNLRGELEKLAKLAALPALGLKAGIAKSSALTAQKATVARARNARSSAFQAARGPRKRRGR